LSRKEQYYYLKKIICEKYKISINDFFSILSHYVCIDDKINLPYSKLADNIIEDLIKDNIDNYHLLSEDASQYFLFDFSKFKMKNKEKKFTFIDLFAGIGGFRLAMQNVGGECVFSSEWDENAQKTYFVNFGEVPFGDITLEKTKSYIPDNFDVLCAGFPCQAFSIAGYRKGFEDSRGTLFFDVAEIIKRKRPKAIFLENVKNLFNHDGGKTFATITKILEDLQYKVFYKVMNAMEYANVPQNRERLFIVCFDPKQVPNYKSFYFPEKIPLKSSIKDCIDYSIVDGKYFYTEKMSHFDELQNNINSFESIYQWRRQYVRENKSKVCPTLTANMGTGGHNVPLILTQHGIRKLTPKECINFQGFPKDYCFPNIISTSSMYKQAGNSVVVPLIQRVCKNLISVICQNS
jgi:DNA-methyltransferase (dcm)